MAKSIKKTCNRGHVFYKSSDCPVCPQCWSGYYRQQDQGDFPDKLSAPALRALLNANIFNLTQLSAYSEADILQLHGMGPSSIPILNAALKQKNLSFNEQLMSAQKTKKILTLHPQGKQGVNIDKAKYDQMKTAILEILKNKQLTHNQLFEALHQQLADKFEGSISWYGETVKLDLEARGLIKRTNDKPQQYKLTNKKS